MNAKTGIMVTEPIQELRYPPSDIIVAFRIEFADGSVYHISRDMRRRSVTDRKAKKTEVTDHQLEKEGIAFPKGKRSN